MQSTPIHSTSMSSPSYSFPAVLSPLASYTTPVTTNIFDDSLLKESPDLEMLSEVALQTSPSTAHRNFLLRHQQSVATASPGKIHHTHAHTLTHCTVSNSVILFFTDEEGEVDTSQRLIIVCVLLFVIIYMYL